MSELMVVSLKQCCWLCCTGLMMVKLVVVLENIVIMVIMVMLMFILMIVDYKVGRMLLVLMDWTLQLSNCRS